jgi:hypothetical protein
VVTGAEASPSPTSRPPRDDQVPRVHNARDACFRMNGGVFARTRVALASDDQQKHASPRARRVLRSAKRECERLGSAAAVAGVLTEGPPRPSTTVAEGIWLLYVGATHGAHVGRRVAHRQLRRDHHRVGTAPLAARAPSPLRAVQAGADDPTRPVTIAPGQSRRVQLSRRPGWWLPPNTRSVANSLRFANPPAGGRP